MESVAPGEASTIRHQEAMLLLILASVQFTNIVDFMIVMPLGTPLMRDLGITTHQFGLIVACYTISAGLAGLLGSSILDRFGRKTAFLTLYAGFLLGTLFCGLSNGFLMLLIARLVTGAFGGVLGGLALAIIADVFPEARRGRATGILMSAFALASVIGVPSGIYLGGQFGWHAPFIALAGLGLPVIFAGLRILPPLRDHIHGPHRHPVKQIVETFSQSNHLRSFALIGTVMIGGFSVIPYIAMYLVLNVGLNEKTGLLWVYAAGGILSLVGAPMIGRLADHFGKLPVFRVVATISAVLILVITNLPRVSLAMAVGVVGLLMLSNAGRMVAALAMVMNSAERRLRGGFMSANSAVQHLASGLGAYIGGEIIDKAPDGTLIHFNRVGLIAVAATAISLWLAGRVRPAQAPATATDLNSETRLGPTEGTGGIIEHLPSTPVVAESLS